MANASAPASESCTATASRVSRSDKSVAGVAGTKTAAVVVPTTGQLSIPLGENREVTVAFETGPADAEPARVDGRHWLLDFSGCRCAAPLLADRATLEATCLDACNAAGLSVVGSRFHQFVPHGVTGVVLLAESHLAVHTWPDERFAAVDVYVCNHAEDNGSKGERLSHAMASLFQADAVDERVLRRRSVVRRLVPPC